MTLVTLIASTCDTSAMVLGMANPPVDHKWEYEINDSPP